MDPWQEDELARSSEGAEQEKLAARSESKSLATRFLEFTRKFPDFAVVVAVLVLDLLILGPIAGYGLEPVRVWQDGEFLARPFGQVYAYCDPFCMSIASSQIALLSFWVCFSHRILLSRIASWLCTLVVLSIVLLALMSARYSLLDLAIFFTSLSFGVAAGGLLLRLRCWKFGTIASFQSSGGKPRQFGIKELILLSTLIGVLCVVVAAAARLTGFYALQFLLQLIQDTAIWSRQLFVVVLGLCTAILGVSCIPKPNTTGNKHASAAKRFLICIAAILAAGSISSLTYLATVWFQSSVTFSDPFRYPATGTLLWINLHIGWQAMILIVLGKFGIAAHRERAAIGGHSAFAKIAIRITATAAVLTLITWTFSYAPSFLKNWQLARQVQHVGSLYHQPAGYQLVVESPVDDSAFAALKAHPIVTKIIVIDRKATESPESLKNLAEMRWVTSFDFYNWSLPPERMANFRKVRPKVAIRAF